MRRSCLDVAVKGRLLKYGQAAMLEILFQHSRLLIYVNTLDLDDFRSVYDVSDDSQLHLASVRHLGD